MGKKQVVVSFLCGAALATATGAFADSQQIQAYLQDVNFNFSGQTATGQAINYDGHLYVPVRFMADSIGSQVTWNSDSSTVGVQLPYTPPKTGNNVTYIQDMQTLSQSNGGYAQFQQNFTDNLGGTYGYGGLLVGAENSGEHYDGTYFLDGDYTEFKGVLAPSSDFATEQSTPNIGHLEIYADGNLVYSSGSVASDITKPVNVDVSLKGVSKLEIKLEGGESGESGFIGLLNAQFIK